MSPGPKATSTARTQKIAKNLPYGYHHTTLSGYIFATKARIDNPKKNLLNSNISSTCPHNMVNVGPLTAEIGLPVWGAPTNFNRFRVLASLLQRRATSLKGGQPTVARCLVVCWAGTLHIHFWGLLPPDGILAHAEFTLRPSLAFSYILADGLSQTLRRGTRNRITEISQRVPFIFGWAGITFGIGPHSRLYLFCVICIASLIFILVFCCIWFSLVLLCDSFLPVS